MKRNAKMAIVLSALVALTMAFASCGGSSSSSKADTSSAASSAAESTAAEESKAAEESTPAAESTAAEESTAAPAESTADPAAEVDTAVLTGSVWTSTQLAKEDGTMIGIDEYAAEIGADAATMGTNLVFTADGQFIMQSGALEGGFATGTYTVDGKNIVTNVNGNETKLEMAQSEGNWALGQENAQPR